MLSPNPTSCPICHQSTHLDSLTGRCILCRPIQIGDIQPELQAYAQRAQSQRYKQLAIGILLGPIAIIICIFTVPQGKSVASYLVWIFAILTPFLVGMSVFSFMRKGTLWQRYYRLGAVMQMVKPLDAELRLSVISSKSSSTYRFYPGQLGPDSVWPLDPKEGIRIDIPAQKDKKAIKGNFLARLDPNSRQPFWAKVYFDPDQSGSAVIRIADSVFVSASENNQAF